MKKILSVLCVTMLLCAVLAMPTSAAVAPAVRVDGPAQAKAGDTIGVAVYVQGAIGGVEATLQYDPAKLDYVSTTLPADVVALGNTEDVTVRVDEATGTIRILCLSNVDAGISPDDAWLTLNFTVLMDTASDEAAVTLNNVVASDMDGTASVVVTEADTDLTVMDETNPMIDMQGATIRTDGAGIRFESTKAVAFDAAEIAEAGVLMFPTALLYDGQDLELTTVGKRGTVPAVAKVTDAAQIAKIAGGESLFATLTSSTTGGRGNVAITARAYVKMTSGDVYYYSFNDSDTPVVTAGAANRSVVSVAQSIAKTAITKGATDTLDGLEEKAGNLTDDEVATLIAFCKANVSYLK